MVPRARLREWPRVVARHHLVVVPSQFLSKDYVDGLEPHFFDPAFAMACNTNKIYFEHVLRMLHHHHQEKDLSKCTLVDICGTDNPSIVNNIPRETFEAQVDAMKRKLGLPVASGEAERVAESRARFAARAEARAKREATVVVRRAKRDAAVAAARAAEAQRLQALKSRTYEEQNRLGTIRETQKKQAEREANDGKAPTFQLHDGCSVAFPKQNLDRNLFRHLTAHNPGTNQQGPTPMHRSSVFCPSLTACTACQDWVQELAEGTASVGLPGASWAHKRHAVLGVAADVRAAFPSITFGGVDLQVPAKTLEDKLMGLTTSQAVGTVKHALAKCNAVGLFSMDSATYRSAFVPHFMAHLGLTDVKKVPARTTLHAVYMAHKRGEADVAEGAGPSKRGLTAPPARKRGPTAPPARSSKRARKATKVTDV